MIGANGPKGMAVARELGDGVMTIGAGEPSFDWCAALAFGTVLDDGEDPGSPRALSAAGPGLTVVYHAMYEGDPGSVDALPGGAEWRARIEEIPEAARHLAVHEDHLVRVTDRDRPLLNGDLLKAFTWTGNARRDTHASRRARSLGRQRDPLRADGSRRSRGSSTRS